MFSFGRGGVKWFNANTRTLNCLYVSLVFATFRVCHWYPFTLSYLANLKRVCWNNMIVMKVHSSVCGGVSWDGEYGAVFLKDQQFYIKKLYIHLSELSWHSPTHCFNNRYWHLCYSRYYIGADIGLNATSLNSCLGIVLPFQGL